MELSILIATVPPRKKYLNKLLFNLQKQIVENNLQDKIEIIVYKDNFEKIIGYKKNKLYESAFGKYVVSIDDDDMISDDYCKVLIDVISKYDVDQISFTQAYYHNNKKNWVPIYTSKNNKYYHIDFGFGLNFFITKYDKNKNSNFEIHFGRFKILGDDNFFKKLLISLILMIFNKKIKKSTRHCSHNVVLKKEIAQSVKFTTDRSKEEDIEWATEIYKKKLIKTDYIIDKVLYHYYYDHDMSITRSDKKVLTKEEKKDTFIKNLKSTKDIDWVIRPIDKINIRWI